MVILLLDLMKWVLPLKIHMGNTWCTIDIQCMIYDVCKWRLHCLFQCTIHTMGCVLPTVLVWYLVETVELIKTYPIKFQIEQ